MYDEIRSNEINITRIFTMSFTIFKECFFNYLMLAVIVYLPINILTNLSISQKPNLIMALIQLVILFMTLLCQLGITYIVEKKIKDDERVSFSEAFNVAFKNWGKAVLTILLASILLFFLYMLFIVPGIIFSIYYSFVISIVILRQVSGIQALNYSKSLVKGKWWKVFGYTLIFGVLSVCLVFGFTAWNYSSSNIIIQITVDTFSSFLSTFFTTCMTILFLNLDYLKNNI